MPFQSDEPPARVFSLDVLAPGAQRAEALEVMREYVQLPPAQASPEPVTSTGDGSTPITIQGDEGASPAVAVVGFVLPLLIMALAFGGVYRLFRWAERRRG